MARSKQQLEAMLREQMSLLRTSLDSFYAGNFAEALRIATAIRVLVHETGSSKPLLKQARPDALDLQIKEHVEEAKRDEEEVFSFRGMSSSSSSMFASRPVARCIHATVQTKRPSA